MAAQPILECFQQEDKWFTGVVVTDGRGSPRDSLYKNIPMRKCALFVSRNSAKQQWSVEFAAQIMLDIPSKVIKDPSEQSCGRYPAILRATKPKFVYTHNLADKHDTHVAVVLRVIEALRELDRLTSRASRWV